MRNALQIDRNYRSNVLKQGDETSLSFRLVPMSEQLNLVDKEAKIVIYKNNAIHYVTYATIERNNYITFSIKDVLNTGTYLLEVIVDGVHKFPSDHSIEIIINPSSDGVLMAEIDNYGLDKFKQEVLDEISGIDFEAIEDLLEGFNAEHLADELAELSRIVDSKASLMVVEEVGAILKEYGERITNVEELEERISPLIEALEDNGYTLDNLKESLDRKADKDHRHSIKDINDLEDVLYDKVDKETLDELLVALDGKVDLGKLDDLATKQELLEQLEQKLDKEVLEEIEALIDNKSDKGHKHSIDDIEGLEGLELSQYATHDEVDDKLSGKADSSHTHTMNDIVDYKEPDLSEYSKKGHAHSADDIRDLEDIIVEHISDVQRGDLSDEDKALLGSKADKVHKHIIDDVEGLEGRLDDKSDKDHTHNIEDIQGYQPTDISHLATKEELGAKANQTRVNSLESELNHKLNKDEVDSLLADKADVIYVQDIEELLGNKIEQESLDVVLDMLSDKANNADFEYLLEELESKVDLEAFASLKEFIDTKANKDYVDGKADKESLELIEEMLGDKAEVEDLADVLERLKSKADKSEIQVLATKEELLQGLDGKVDQKVFDKIEELLYTKADTKVVEEQLNQKADRLELEALATKEELVQGLDEKADQFLLDNVREELVDKANKSDVDELLESLEDKVDLETLINRLGEKANLGHEHLSDDIVDLEDTILKHIADMQTGELSDEDKALINSKADKLHKHEIRDVVGLEEEIDKKSDKEHRHVLADIKDYVEPDFSNYVTKDGLDKELATKSDVEHTHHIDDIEGYKSPDLSTYATKSMLGEKADKEHVHIITDINGLQEELANKALKSHRHSTDDIDGIRNYATLKRLEDLDKSIQSSLLLVSSKADSKANKEHRHTLEDITDYVEPDFTPYATKDEVEGLSEKLTEIDATDRLQEIEADFEELSSSIDSKANLEHTHVIQDVQGLEDELSSKANSEHKHTLADIEDYIEPDLSDLATKKEVEIAGDYQRLKQEFEADTELLGKLAPKLWSAGGNTALYVQNEFSGKSTINVPRLLRDNKGIIETSLSDSFAPFEHTHQASEIEDLKEFVLQEIADVQAEGLTEEQLAMLDSKADKIHTHSMKDIEGLNAVLSGKSDEEHRHSVSEIDGLEVIIDNTETQLSVMMGDINDYANTNYSLIGDLESRAFDRIYKNRDSISETNKSVRLLDERIDGLEDSKSDVGHTHKLTDIEDYVEPDLSSYVTYDDFELEVKSLIESITETQLEHFNNFYALRDYSERKYLKVDDVDLNSYAKKEHVHVIDDVEGLDKRLTGIDVRMGGLHVSTRETERKFNNFKEFVEENYATNMHLSNTQERVLEVYRDLDNKADKSYVDNELNKKANVSHTHTIGQVTNLQSTLNSKAATNHKHSIDDVTGLRRALNETVTSNHTHSIDQITGLRGELDAIKSEYSKIRLVSSMPAYPENNVLYVVRKQ